MSSFLAEKKATAPSLYIDSDIITKASNIFNICKDIDSNDDDSTDDAFSIHVENVISKLNEKLLTINDNNVKQCEIIRAKHGKAITTTTITTNSTIITTTTTVTNTDITTRLIRCIVSIHNIFIK